MTLENSVINQTCKDNGDFNIVDGILVEYLSNDSSVVIPDGVIKINDRVFLGDCVTSVSIPVSVKKINEYAFNILKDIHYAGTREQWNKVRKSICWRKSADVVHCIDGDEELPQFYFRDNVLENYYGVSDSVVIPENVNRIGEAAFAVCESVVSIIIPDGVTEIGERAFMGCESLNSIVIPDSVMEIGDYAFENCESLEYITIPPNVQTINECLFVGCTSLKSVNIPASVKKICSCAFKDCSALAEIHFAGTKKQWNLVKKDEDWRKDIPASSVQCKDGSIELSPFRINDGVLEQYYGVSESVVIPNNVIEIDDGAFDGCKSLKSICIPEGVMEIHDSTFSQCILLESVSIPKSVRIIEEEAFCACVSLSSIDVPDGVIKIYDRAFFDCMNLASINIPASVTEIGKNAFCGCQALKEIHYAGTEKQWNAMVKGDGWNEDCPDLKVIFDQKI